MLLIVGLGNPGPIHEKQRHNVGFMAVDSIHRHENFSAWKPRFQSLTAEGTLTGDPSGEKVILIKPATFMNESGRAVGQAMRYYKIEHSQIIVLYDELDLAPGKIRIKTGGGAGGHNGIRSIDAHIGKDYRRMRIGIGHPGHKDRVTGHVLGNFAKSDYVWLDPLLEEVAGNAGLLASGDDPGFLNRIALRNRSDEPSSAKGRKPAKAKSHIRAANQSAIKPPTSGPMANMLKKLLGGNGD